MWSDKDRESLGTQTIIPWDIQVYDVCSIRVYQSKFAENYKAIAKFTKM